MAVTQDSIKIVICFLLASCMHSCTKYVDAAFTSTNIDHASVVTARFPIGRNEDGASHSIRRCLQYAKIQDSNCTWSKDTIVCELQNPKDGPSFCLVDENKINY